MCSQACFHLPVLGPQALLEQLEWAAWQQAPLSLRRRGRVTPSFLPCASGTTVCILAPCPARN